MHSEDFINFSKICMYYSQFYFLTTINCRTFENEIFMNFTTSVNIPQYFLNRGKKYLTYFCSQYFKFAISFSGNSINVILKICILILIKKGN